jgi:hypothetical protein
MQVFYGQKGISPFKSDNFEVFFNLWNNGGAHWEKEF